jgi:hypothetical protein
MMTGNVHMFWAERPWLATCASCVAHGCERNLESAADSCAASKRVSSGRRGHAHRIWTPTWTSIRTRSSTQSLVARLRVATISAAQRFMDARRAAVSVCGAGPCDGVAVDGCDQGGSRMRVRLSSTLGDVSLPLAAAELKLNASATDRTQTSQPRASGGRRRAARPARALDEN